MEDILWIDKAFGAFWSFLNGHWSLISGVFEGGLFAVLFLDYLEPVFGQAKEKMYNEQLRVPFGIILMGVVVAINMYGMEMVSNASLLFTVASLGPFIALVVVGFPSLDLAVQYREGRNLTATRNVRRVVGARLAHVFDYFVVVNIGLRFVGHLRRRGEKSEQNVRESDVYCHGIRAVD